MIGYWGYVMFEVNSDWAAFPAEMQREAGGRFDTYYPINSALRPVNIFKGAENGRVTFTMHLDQRLMKGRELRDLIDEMIVWVNMGVAGELVIGTKPMGHNKWVCTKMTQKYLEILHGGVITAADIEVTLEEI